MSAAVVPHPSRFAADVYALRRGQRGMRRKGSGRELNEKGERKGGGKVNPLIPLH